VPELVDILETIAEFRSASLELLAWEFDVAPPVCKRKWREAIETGLLQSSGVCPQTGEAMYGLTRRGAIWLHEHAKATSDLVRQPASVERLVHTLEHLAPFADESLLRP
jgi:hypothetical protein